MAYNENLEQITDKLAGSMDELRKMLERMMKIVPGMTPTAFPGATPEATFATWAAMANGDHAMEDAAKMMAAGSLTDEAGDMKLPESEPPPVGSSKGPTPVMVIKDGVEMPIEPLKTPTPEPPPGEIDSGGGGPMPTPRFEQTRHEHALHRGRMEFRKSGDWRKAAEAYRDAMDMDAEEEAAADEAMDDGQIPIGPAPPTKHVDTPPHMPPPRPEPPPIDSVRGLELDDLRGLQQFRDEVEAGDQVGRDILEADLQEQERKHKWEMWTWEQQHNFNKRAAYDMANMHRRIEWTTSQHERSLDTLTDTNV